MRRAKIVCTMGPATSSPETMRKLVQAGMDVARLNFSHGSHEDKLETYKSVRAASDEAARAVGILADLQGPKIRTGRFENGPILLARGDRFTITTDDILGDGKRVGTTYKGLPGDVTPGELLLIDDGKVTLRAVDVTATDVVCEVVEGGYVSNNKGINLPGVAVSVPALSDKDTEDLRFALEMGVDLVALSFVRTAADLDDVHAIMDEVGRRVPVIAKIEKPQAVEHLEEIVQRFDAIMVARGDLGVELPFEDVPIVQKQAIELARQYAKPVIVATQVLESMIENSRPTRAEASDCANAILDGADAVMLSGETSVGKWPIETVQAMARIIESTEEHGLERLHPMPEPSWHIGDAVTQAAVDVAKRLDVKYLVTFTQSGKSARLLSRLRCRIPVLAFSPEQSTRSRLSLSWGVETFLVPGATHTDEMVNQVDLALLAAGRCVEGDYVVMVAGTPPGVAGSTNSVRVHRIGDSVNHRIGRTIDYAG